MNKSSQLIVSLDGLSLPDLHLLIELLPKSAPHLRGGSTAILDAGLLTAPSAIWGEILTGVPWHENGCSGYSVPQKNLNSTRVATEKDLKVPLRLLHGDGDELIINVPLLMPKLPHRTWLSDGSLPLPITVSPSSVSSEQRLPQYKPRKFGSLPILYEGTMIGVENVIAEETSRLQWADDLLDKQSWSTCIVRVSFFDRLAHLIGTDYLSDQNLIYTKPISEFLSTLDDWLASLLAREVNVSIVSAFSHTRCSSRFNLNRLLQDGMFLEFETIELDASHRVLAFASMIDEQEPGTKEKARRLHRNHIRARNCHQPSFELARTKAASATQGCIWINSKDKFLEGTLEPSETVSVYGELKTFLEKELARRFDNFKLWSRGDFQEVEGVADLSKPDFFVFIPGVELHNSLDKNFRKHDVPRCVHHPEGFVWSRSSGLPGTVDSSRLAEYI